MAKSKEPKKAHEQTSDEIAKRVFPKEVHEHLKNVAKEAEKKADHSSQKPD